MDVSSQRRAIVRAVSVGCIRKFHVRLASMVGDSFIAMMNIDTRDVMGMEMRNGLAHASVRKKQDAEHQKGEALPHPGCVTSEAESNNLITSLVSQPVGCDTGARSRFSNGLRVSEASIRMAASKFDFSYLFILPELSSRSTGGREVAADDRRL